MATPLATASEQLRASNGSSALAAAIAAGNFRLLDGDRDGRAGRAEILAHRAPRSGRQRAWAALLRTNELRQHFV